MIAMAVLQMIAMTSPPDDCYGEIESLDRLSVKTSACFARITLQSSFGGAVSSSACGLMCSSARLGPARGYRPRRARRLAKISRTADASRTVDLVPLIPAQDARSTTVTGLSAPTARPARRQCRGPPGHSAGKVDHVSPSYFTGPKIAILQAVGSAGRPARRPYWMFLGGYLLTLNRLSDLMSSERDSQLSRITLHAPRVTDSASVAGHPRGACRYGSGPLCIRALIFLSADTHRTEAA